MCHIDKKTGVTPHYDTDTAVWLCWLCKEMLLHKTLVCAHTSLWERGHYVVCLFVA